MKQLRKFALAAALCAMALAFTACGGSGPDAPQVTQNPDGTLSAEKSDAINIYMCAEYLSEDAANELMDELKSSVDALKNGAIKLNTEYIITGDGQDPTMQMAGMMKLGASVAAQEVDILIADDVNAARNARGDTFHPLSDLLTEDEIAKLGKRALAYETVDEDGNLTGTMTPVCGIDLTGDERLRKIFGDKKVGIFVAGNAPNFENSKIVFEALTERIAAASAPDAASADMDGAQSESANTAAPNAAGTAADAGNP